MAEAITTHGSPRVGSGRDLHSHPNRSRIRLCESHRPGQSDLAETWVRSRCLQPKTIKTRPITTNEQTIKTPSHNSLLAMALLRARNLTLCLLIGRQKKGNPKSPSFPRKAFRSVQRGRGFDPAPQNHTAVAIKIPAPTKTRAGKGSAMVCALIVGNRWRK